MTDDPIELFASARPAAREHDATELEAVWTAATTPAFVDEVPLVGSTVVHPARRRRRTVALAVAAALVVVIGMVATNRSPRLAERGTGRPSATPETAVEESTTTSAAGRPFVGPDCTVTRGPQEPMAAADRIASQLLLVGPALYRGIGPLLPASAARGAVGSVCRTDQGGRLADGDAPYPPGTPLMAVNGYDPHFRLGVVVGERLDVYELVDDPTARTGADLLDLSVGVDAVELRDLEGGDALLDTWTDGRVAALVAGMTAASVDRRTPTSEGFRYRLVFRLRDGTTTERAYDTVNGMLPLEVDAATRSLFDGAPRGAQVVAPTTAPIGTTVATTAPANPLPCVHSVDPAVDGGIVLTVDAVRCEAGAFALKVANSGATTCTSDQVATLSDGTRLLFRSTSGYGGESGSWAPAAADAVDAVGVIEYPPGARQWPLQLPDLANGTYTLTLTMQCGDRSLSLIAWFAIRASEPEPATVGTLPLPAAVPDHGIAYTTPKGVVVAALDGTFVFDLPGWRVTDRSPDVARAAALVSGADGSTFALTPGRSAMAPAALPAPSNVPGWVASTMDGCLRDARRVDGRLLLCSLTSAGLPRAIDRDRGGGRTNRVAGAPTVAAPGSGHWADAVQGPTGRVAATWSGDCESLSSYRIGADGVPVLLVPGESAVLGWDGDDVLVARFGGCGPSSPDDGVYRVGADGSSTRIPTPDAIEPAVGW